MVVFGTKAETLAQLYGKLNYGKILPQVSFTARDWENVKCDIFWDCCIKKLESNVFIIRSSALNEDTATGSQAGKFESVGNVRNAQEFTDAVNKVIASFDSTDGNNQILVQTMLENVVSCGVAF